MNRRLFRVRGKGRFVIALLAASLLLAAADAYGQRKRGATIIVTPKYGLQERGELIQVRPKSILILKPAGQDASIDLSEIAKIRLIRRPKVPQGLLVGLLAGAGIGYLGGRMNQGDDPCESLGSRLVLFYGGGLTGLVVGGIAGTSAGKDLYIQVDGASPSVLEASLRKMAKYARLKEFSSPSWPTSIRSSSTPTTSRTSNGPECAETESLEVFFLRRGK